MKLKENYIKYLKISDNETVLSALDKFIEKKIDFLELENIAIDNNLFSMRVYDKSIKINNLLK